ncbi:polysaccharide lyase family 1 protein [Parabacteroides sp. FAFU027]|uniref:pectate lyase family protein n=1 Tax=Parabacteroides sp. FAFU027 TaxID=2922715 RepID=UPI001FAF591A|nr:pectate lyase [Parabacteroides sp. FAFU027]
MKLQSIKTAVLGISLLLGGNAIAQKKVTAFPGAEGFGKYTTGGRGGKAVYVTNLDDDGPGSLRQALKTKGPHTVLFKVSGTIYLKTKLNISSGDVTIAGQSAPGDGICIAGAPTSISADNVIVRYLRFRMGDLNAIEDDAFGGRFHKNIIIDHCSMSWSTDECGSFYGNENFTLQWSILSESLKMSVHHKGAHGYGGIWGGKNATFHHNLLAHHDSRNPRLDHPGITQITGITDLRNNVIYNWGGNSTYGGETHVANVVNNYYKPGPATPDSRKKYFFNPSNETGGKATGFGKFYVSGNILEGNNAINQDNHKGIKPQSPVSLDSILFTKPLDNAGIKTETAQQAFESVLKSAGANLHRDPVDARVVDEVRTGKAPFGTNGHINSQKDVGGWPELKSTAAPIDSDNDGMPDSWEIKNKLNPKDPSDGAKSSLDKQYTNLEVYLNSLVK